MGMVNWRGGTVHGNFLGISLLVFEHALLGCYHVITQPQEVVVCRRAYIS